jgi:hypothetical protein
VPRVNVAQVTAGGATGTSVLPHPTAADATNDHQFSWAKGRVLVVRNNHASTACNVTIPTPATVGGLAVGDQGPTAVAALTTRIFGPFQESLYKQSDGNVYIDLDFDTTVFLGTLDIPVVD